MSLKINGWHRIVKWSLWGVFGVLFLVFFIRIVTFEASYYDEKDGSERAVVEEEPVEEELVEIKPTEEEVKEYNVAPDRPRYLTIEKIGVSNARIIAVGVNASGELSTPSNIFDVGWYVDSGKPGAGGTMIIDGHNGGPHMHGVFKNLPDLKEGDIIRIERGDGTMFNYKVVENKEVSLDKSNDYMAVAATSPVPGVESVTIITCTGEWSQAQRTYLSRQFTRAIIQN